MLGESHASSLVRPWSLTSLPSSPRRASSPACRSTMGCCASSWSSVTSSRPWSMTPRWMVLERHHGAPPHHHVVPFLRVTTTLAQMTRRADPDRHPHGRAADLPGPHAKVANHRRMRPAIAGRRRPANAERGWSARVMRNRAVADACEMLRTCHRTVHAREPYRESPGMACARRLGARRPWACLPRLRTAAILRTRDKSRTADVGQPP